MEILAVDLKCLSPFHTTGAVAGSFIEVLKWRSPGGRITPYIPATHIKGVMRCEAERMLRTTENIPCFITGDPNPDHPKKIVVCDEVNGGGYRCPICSLFGVPNTQGGGGYREGKIRVLDFYPSHFPNQPDIKRRTHVMIDREFLVKVDEGLYSEEAIAAGTIFSGHIIIRTPLSENEERILMASLHAMAAYGLGKNRSRGFGQIEVLKVEKTDRVSIPEGAVCR